MLVSNAKIFRFSIYSIAILFLTLYLILSFHSRLAGDDFFYLWLKNNFGAWDGMLYQYKRWSGRWSAHYIGCALVSKWTNPFFLPFVNLLTLGFLILSIKIGVKRILHSINSQINGNLIFGLTILLATTFFFTSYSIGETWFWYIIILTYLWSLICFVFLLDLIFSENKNLFVFLSLIFCSAFIGGASESFAIIFLSLLFLLLMLKIFAWKELLRSVSTNKLILAILFIAVSFVFSALAPGTEIRHSLLPHTTFVDKIFVFFKSYLKYFIRFLPQKLPLYILFSFPWLFGGAYFFKNEFAKLPIKKIIIKISLLFLLVIAILFIPTSLIMSETGPGRALSVVSFFTTIYFALIFSLIGIYINVEKKFFKYSSIGISFLSISFLTYLIFTQYDISKKFSAAVDQRLKIIEDARQNNFIGVLELEKIPSQGLLYWDEISEDTSYFTNKHLKEGLGLNFPVKLHD